MLYTKMSRYKANDSAYMFEHIYFYLMTLLLLIQFNNE